MADAIFNRGGIIRQIDNLGQLPTPYKAHAHGRVHRAAGYFIIHFDVPPRKLEDFQEECSRDTDIIRQRPYKKTEPKTLPCTWHEEMLPPAYRFVYNLMEKILHKEIYCNISKLMQ